jgi:replicative DNA helicase
MTSRPKLAVVAHEATEVHAPRAETVLRQWEPEAQLVGALMHLTRAHVTPILELVPDTAIWRPDNRWAYELIRRIVEHGDDPNPVVVLSTARQYPPADTAHPERPVSPTRHHQFAVHLAGLYTQAVTPAAARRYARDVLEDAYRRAVELHGIRVAELARSGSSRRQLTDYLTTMRAELAELARRAEATAA